MQHAGQLVDLRRPGILGSRVDGDPNVLCITSAKTLDKGILGCNSNGVAEDYKDHSFSCLSITRKVLALYHYQALGKNVWFLRQQRITQAKRNLEALQGDTLVIRKFISAPTLWGSVVAEVAQDF